MGAARGLLAGIALLALAFVVDLAVEEVRRWGTANFRSLDALAVVAVAQLGFAALLVGLAWLVATGPRSRLIGLAMALVGGYVALLPAVLWLDFDTLSRLPFTLRHSLGIGAFAWTGAVVAVLGVVELAWPTPARSRSRDGEGSASDADLRTPDRAA